MVDSVSFDSDLEVNTHGLVNQAQFGDLMTASEFIADIVVLLASLDCDLKHS